MLRYPQVAVSYALGGRKLESICSKTSVLRASPQGSHNPLRIALSKHCSFVLQLGFLNPSLWLIWTSWGWGPHLVHHLCIPSGWNQPEQEPPWGQREESESSWIPWLQAQGAKSGLCSVNFPLQRRAVVTLKWVREICPCVLWSNSSKHPLWGNMGCLGSSEGKESACNAGDTRDAGYAVPGSGRSSGEGNGNPH